MPAFLLGMLGKMGHSTVCKEASVTYRCPNGFIVKMNWGRGDPPPYPMVGLGMDALLKPTHGEVFD